MLEIPISKEVIAADPFDAYIMYFDYLNDLYGPGGAMEAMRLNVNQIIETFCYPCTGVEKAISTLYHIIHVAHAIPEILTTERFFTENELLLKNAIDNNLYPTLLAFSQCFIMNPFKIHFGMTLATHISEAYYQQSISGKSGFWQSENENALVLYLERNFFSTWTIPDAIEQKCYDIKALNTFIRSGSRAAHDLYKQKINEMMYSNLKYKTDHLYLKKVHLQSIKTCTWPYFSACKSNAIFWLPLLVELNVRPHISKNNGYSDTDLIMLQYDGLDPYWLSVAKHLVINGDRLTVTSQIHDKIDKDQDVAYICFLASIFSTGKVKSFESVLGSIDLLSISEMRSFAKEAAPSIMEGDLTLAKVQKIQTAESKEISTGRKLFVEIIESALVATAPILVGGYFPSVSGETLQFIVNSLNDHQVITFAALFVSTAGYKAMKMTAEEISQTKRYLKEKFLRHDPSLSKPPFLNRFAKAIMSLFSMKSQFEKATKITLDLGRAYKEGKLDADMLTPAAILKISNTDEYNP